MAIHSDFKGKIDGKPSILTGAEEGGSCFEQKHNKSADELKTILMKILEV